MKTKAVPTAYIPWDSSSSIPQKKPFCRSSSTQLPIYDEAEAFAKNGPDEASLNKVKEYMLKKHSEDLKENGYWLNSIDEYLYTGIDPVKDYEQIINSITPKDVQQFANELLKQKNQITVSMISPEKK